MRARHVMFRVQPPVPFGEVTLVPAPLCGRPEAEAGRAMAEALAHLDMPTASDALGKLRQAFPTAPLSARIAALGVIMERLRNSRDLW